MSAYTLLNRADCFHYLNLIFSNHFAFELLVFWRVIHEQQIFVFLLTFQSVPPDDPFQSLDILWFPVYKRYEILDIPYDMGYHSEPCRRCSGVFKLIKNHVRIKPSNPLIYQNIVWDSGL